jgi:4-hydroxy-4-methyl-2-oxoglutarate aldolase
MDEITDRLSRLSSAIVHDVMRAMSLSGFVLPSELTPLIAGRHLCGPVFTIEGRVESGSDPHTTLLDWTGLLSKARPGHIWVCQPNDREVGHMGELSGETLKKKGVLGCVVDGGIRDTERLTEIGFQCWRRFHTPRDVVGYWRPSGFDLPIMVGDVEIRPGDYLIGDGDGMVRLPADAAETITARALEAMASENKVRAAILAGMDPQAAYLAHGKF